MHILNRTVLSSFSATVMHPISKKTEKSVFLFGLFPVTINMNPARVL